MSWRKLFCAVFLVALLHSQSPPAVSASSHCDLAQFVSDVSVPDGTSFMTGTSFTKTWRLLNAGNCTWTTAYKLIFESGDPMGAPASVNLPVDVPPGQALDISVNMTAPAAAGHYVGYWKLSNEAGIPFGIGASGEKAFWVEIQAVEVTSVIYDFVTNAPYAQWKSGADALPFPGTSGDGRGFSYQVDNPRLEDGSVASLPSLLVVPQNKYNGYIQAVYPELLVQKGDRFQTLVNCEFGARNCYVTFRLDYMTASGAVRTLWTWKEAYDGRFYRANIDLSPLAGQRVRFILTLLASGYASGDRALWGAPRIIRTGSVEPPSAPPTLTPLPALTPTPTPFSTPPPVMPAACEKAAFVADVTVPDGTRFSPGAAFTKIWRLRNSGTCAWTTSYHFVFYSGSRMSAPTALRMPATVYPGQTVDLALNMVAPLEAGMHRGHWILQNANGGLFGIGRDAAMPVWVEINVAGDASMAMGYDFVKNACAAEWKSGAGRLPCPGAYGDRAGYIIPVDAPKLEDGSTGTVGLLVAPQDKYNGYIQGFYPTITVQPGDRFRTTVGCEHGASCYVTFRLDVMNAAGGISTFWTWREQNEGRFYNANVDLTPLAGRSVRFILTLLATGPATGDRVVWGAPYIERAHAPATATPPPAFTPVPTSTPPASNWQTHTNATHGFQFKYPLEAQKVDGGSDTFTRINLPFAPATNLKEKYLEIRASEDAVRCQSPLADLSMLEGSEVIVINGITFLKQTGEDRGVGHIHEWIGYSTARDGICVNLDFILHSTNPDNYPTPPPRFDKPAETAVIEQIVSTYAWLSPPAETPTPISLSGPYAVTGVEMDDVLNIRAGAGGSYPVVGGFAWNATNVMRSGAGESVDGVVWVEVQRPGGMGWVNSAYLTEYVPSSNFCMDGRVPAVITQLKQAMNDSNGASFSSLVSPAHGTAFAYWHGIYAARYTPASAQSVFVDATVINWGGGASGIPDIGTFSQIVQPDMKELLNGSYQLLCNDPSYANMYVDPWPHTNLNFYTVQKPATPGVEFDWKIWIVGFEYVDGKPHLFNLRRYIWEP
jgi:hypothetical protein